MYLSLMTNFVTNIGKIREPWLYLPIKWTLKIVSQGTNSFVDSRFLYKNLNLINKAVINF